MSLNADICLINKMNYIFANEMLLKSLKEGLDSFEMSRLGI